MPPFLFLFGSSLLLLLWILFQVCCLFPLHLFALVGFYLNPSSVTYILVISFFWWVGLCSYLADCLAWGIRHWSLQAVGWRQVLLPRWGPLRELTLTNIPGAWRSLLVQWFGLGAPTTGAQVSSMIIMSMVCLIHCGFFPSLCHLPNSLMEFPDIQYLTNIYIPVSISKFILKPAISFILVLSWVLFFESFHSFPIYLEFIFVLRCEKETHFYD